MASLRSMILDRKCAFVEPENFNADERRYAEAVTIATQTQLQSRETILVNIDKVVDDLHDLDWRKTTEWERLPALKPPYQSMWLEGQARGQRCGVLACRVNTPPGSLASLKNFDYLPTEVQSRIKQDQPANFIGAYCWSGDGDKPAAFFIGYFAYWINAQGCLQDNFGQVWPPRNEKDCYLTLGAATALSRLRAHELPQRKTAAGQSRAAAHQARREARPL